MFLIPTPVLWWSFNHLHRVSMHFFSVLTSSYCRILRRLCLTWTLHKTTSLSIHTSNMKIRHWACYHSLGQCWNVWLHGLWAILISPSLRSPAVCGSPRSCLEANGDTLWPFAIALTVSWFNAWSDETGDRVKVKLVLSGDFGLDVGTLSWKQGAGRLYIWNWSNAVRWLSPAEFGPSELGLPEFGCPEFGWSLVICNFRTSGSLVKKRGMFCSAEVMLCFGPTWTNWLLGQVSKLLGT